MPYCPECGSAVQADDAYCGNCGNALARSGAASGGGPEDAPSNDVDDTSTPSSRDTGDEPLSGDQPPVDDGPAGEHREQGGGEPPDGDGGPSRIDVPDDPFDMDTLEFAFKYPIAGGYKPLGIGALLVVVSIFLFPILFLLGYGYRLGRAAALGHPEPPAYGDWWGLLVDGFRLIVTFVIFFIPVGIVQALLIAGGVESLATLWSFAASLVGSAIYPIFYGTGSVSGTYEDLKFLRFVTTADYWIGLAYMIGAVIVLYVGFIVLLLATGITIVGLLLWIPLFLLFYPAMIYVQSTVWGRVYHDAAEEGVVDGPDRADELASSW